METILKIEKTSLNEGYEDQEGYAITTDKQVILLMIDSYQQCCESWGYFMSEDNTDDFINSQLIKIELVDSLLKEKSTFNPNDMYEGDIMFVNITTSKGLLQFVAYNEHNGYYGHEAFVKSIQLNHKISL